MATPKALAHTPKKAKIRYTNEPMGDPKVIPDFLPAPDDLIGRGVREKVKSTKRNAE